MEIIVLCFWKPLSEFEQKLFDCVIAWSTLGFYVWIVWIVTYDFKMCEFSLSVYDSLTMNQIFTFPWFLLKVLYVQQPPNLQ